MGNDNTHPAPSERLEAYYTATPTSEIDTKGNEMLFALSGLFTCFLDIVKIYRKSILKKKTSSKSSIPFRAPFDQLIIITSYLVNGLSFFPVVSEGNSIVTVLKFVLCNPLVNLIPSL